MIHFNHVTKIYEDNKALALEDVSFHVEKGEFVFLVGHSGAGKSSIIRMLLCEETPTEGEVIVNGHNIGALSRKEIPFLRREIGVVFQDFRLLPSRTVYENVAFAMRIVGASPKVIKERVNYVLDLVGLLHKARRKPKELSGGEQQRVAIARALVNNPGLIIADEPTGNLDPDRSLEIMMLLEQINDLGTTVLVVTHEKELVDQFDKRVVAIDSGLIVSDRMGGYYQDEQA